MLKHVRVVYSASLRNSILANYQSDFWKVKGRILVFFYSLHRECFSVLASSSRLGIKQTQKRWQNFLVISLVYFSNYVIDGEYYRFHCVGYVIRILVFFNSLYQECFFVLASSFADILRFS